MPCADRREHAELQAYNWACVADSLKLAMREQEEARKLSNAPGALLTEWQQWLLDHVDPRLDVQQAIALAEMWTKVATVQTGTAASREKT